MFQCLNSVGYQHFQFTSEVQKLNSFIISNNSVKFRFRQYCPGGMSSFQLRNLVYPSCIITEFHTKLEHTPRGASMPSRYLSLEIKSIIFPFLTQVLTSVCYGLRTSAYILLSHFMCNKGKIEKNPNISKLKGKIKRYKAALEKG